MSNDNAGVLQTFRDPLVGLPLSHVWRGAGSAIFLEFGRLTGRNRRDGTPGNPRGEFGLMIQWSWRIEDRSSILCGSWSEDSRWAETFDLIRNRTIVELSLVGRLPEIAVALSDELYVSSFMTAEGDPASALFDRRRDTLRTLCVQHGRLEMEIAQPPEGVSGQ
ncbi:hypothetical protein [Bradyrhizobium sp. STM 3809]|uniref:hypothetical protein n=1 Tax=Bradyrhizobium sp. STM 3809 TaxID=551936 RepID=UPI00024097FB|nr:hypothetical protein [Bradyrhizobium sp. STM 3809]CCE01410.1 hypothetical protein BRAS3809_4910004 [Bradyrhizobium sp. STM 3809]